MAGENALVGEEALVGDDVASAGVLVAEGAVDGSEAGKDAAAAAAATASPFLLMCRQRRAPTPRDS